eukprot:CAMPEP_0114503510 /NCGR_PEP_ID=MMETSP0109-20121206/9688_1 /TAXON_ID=29199 /ORGANISM="Chlorarachnion reptans, Strain CCCM449" /LENGTH=1287 /DNA_ID=CAMNT_0001681547 /DNA_START=125 /DNA_END=3984 /DNA_ORIENTATION=+
MFVAFLLTAAAIVYGDLDAKAVKIEAVDVETNASANTSQAAIFFKGQNPGQGLDPINGDEGNGKAWGKSEEEADLKTENKFFKDTLAMSPKIPIAFSPDDSGGNEEADGEKDEGYERNADEDPFDGQGTAETSKGDDKKDDADPNSISNDDQRGNSTITKGTTSQGQQGEGEIESGPGGNIKAIGSKNEVAAGLQVDRMPDDDAKRGTTVESIRGSNSEDKGGDEKEANSNPKGGQNSGNNTSTKVSDDVTEEKEIGFKKGPSVPDDEAKRDMIVEKILGSIAETEQGEIEEDGATDPHDDQSGRSNSTESTEQELNGGESENRDTENETFKKTSKEEKEIGSKEDVRVPDDDAKWDMIVEKILGSVAQTERGDVQEDGTNTNSNPNEDQSGNGNSTESTAQELNGAESENRDTENGPSDTFKKIDDEDGKLEQNSDLIPRDMKNNTHEETRLDGTNEESSEEREDDNEDEPAASETEAKMSQESDAVPEDNSDVPLSDYDAKQDMKDLVEKILQMRDVGNQVVTAVFEIAKRVALADVHVNVSSVLWSIDMRQEERVRTLRTVKKKNSEPVASLMDWIVDIAGGHPKKAQQRLIEVMEQIILDQGKDVDTLKIFVRKLHLMALHNGNLMQQVRASLVQLVQTLESAHQFANLTKSKVEILQSLKTRLENRKKLTKIFHGAKIDYETGMLLTRNGTTNVSIEQIRKTSLPEVMKVIDAVDPAVMHTNLELLLSILLLIGCACIGGVIAKSFGLPITFGYVAGGIVAGPSGLNLLVELPIVQTLASIGSIFVFFEHGMRFRTGIRKHKGTKTFNAGKAVLISTLQMCITSLLVTLLVQITNQVQTLLEGMIIGVAIGSSSLSMAVEMNMGALKAIQTRLGVAEEGSSVIYENEISNDNLKTTHCIDINDSESDVKFISGDPGKKQLHNEVLADSFAFYTSMTTLATALAVSTDGVLSMLLSLPSKDEMEKMGAISAVLRSLTRFLALVVTCWIVERLNLLRHLQSYLLGHGIQLSGDIAETDSSAPISRATRGKMSPKPNLITTGRDRTRDGSPTAHTMKKRAIMHIKKSNPAVVPKISSKFFTVGDNQIILGLERADPGTSQLSVLVPVALCLSSALVTRLGLGLSLEIGAFIAGLLIAGVTNVRMGTLRTVFGGLLFASIGTIVNPPFFMQNIGPVAISIIVVYVIKLSANFVTLESCNAIDLTSPRRTQVLFLSSSLTGVGELSLIFLGQAQSGNLISRRNYLFCVGVAAISSLIFPHIHAIVNRGFLDNLRKRPLTLPDAAKQT